jgi:ectoine hydroxylase-related dioxygenase (phytanoyl-CoA dioxygenase family)
MAGDAMLQSVRELEDSSALWAAGGVEALRTRLARDGYLLLRGCLPRGDVLKAQRAVLKALHAEAPAGFARGSRPAQARAAPGAAQLGLLRKQHIAAAPPVAAVLESPRLFDLAAALLQMPSAADVITPDFKWSRCVAPGEFTGVHADAAFFRPAADVAAAPTPMLTAWLPLGDVAVELGALVVAPGSHASRALAPLRDSYLARPLGADGTHSGWLAASAAALQPQPPRGWATTDFRAGDVVILRMDVLHLTACNVSDRLRTSCDTRWQPRCAPRDAALARWRGVGGLAA